jgi:hypothetical protein
MSVGVADFVSDSLSFSPTGTKFLTGLLRTLVTGLGSRMPPGGDTTVFNGWSSCRCCWDMVIWRAMEI